MTQPVTIYLALGSNLGDRLSYLHEAVRELGDCIVVDQLSQVYETEPAYVTDQPPFLNMVLSGTTTLSPRELLVCLKALEARMGRTTGRRYGPRPIDVDIVLYGDQIVDEPDLQIPHIRMAERQFVLQPLSELAPDLRPPGMDQTIQALADSAPQIGPIMARLGPLGHIS